jgi:hypothetical protein
MPSTPVHTWIVYPRRLLLFTMLSLMDLLLTCYLLRQGHGQVYESNPLAAWWLTHFGWAGLVGFKVLAVIFVGCLAVVISLRHLRRGGQFLTFACMVVAGVLVYSAFLANSALARTDSEGMEHGRVLHEAIPGSLRYQSLLTEMIGEVTFRHRSLAEAADELARSEKGRDPGWRRLLHTLYPDQCDRACFAINVMNCALVEARADPAKARQLARRLGREFEEMFGKAPPSLASAR